MRPDWRDVEERRQRYVLDYVQAKPNSIDALQSVLEARLWGTGLRGRDFETEVNLAKLARKDRLQSVSTLRR